MPRQKRNRQEGRTWATIQIVETAALIGALTTFLVGAVASSSIEEPVRSIMMFVSVLLGFSFASFAMFWHYGENDKDEYEDDGKEENIIDER